MNAIEFFTENESLLSALAAFAVIVGLFVTTERISSLGCQNPESPTVFRSGSLYLS